jgi:gonadotropin-releasing hormone receptor
MTESDSGFSVSFTYFVLFQVTFLMMPLEIGWNATVSWKAGDAVCRIMSFFRAFGLYLSSFVIVCISLDRCHSTLNTQ